MKKTISPSLLKWYAVEVLKYSEKDLKRISQKQLIREVLYDGN